jgi:hypothetical protein
MTRMRALRQAIKGPTRDGAQVVYATYVGPGSEPGLIDVTVLGAPIADISKLSSLGVLTPGDTLLCLKDRGAPLTAVGALTSAAADVDRSGHLIAYGENSTTSIVSSNPTLITLSNVPLSSQRTYAFHGSCRAHATDSSDFGGLIAASISVGGTVVGRDRTLLRASTSTAATNYLKPDAAGFSPSTSGAFAVVLEGGTSNGVSSDVGWRGAGGDGFAHWLAVFDTGPAL